MKKQYVMREADLSQIEAVKTMAIHSALTDPTLFMNPHSEMMRLSIGQARTRLDIAIAEDLRKVRNE